MLGLSVHALTLSAHAAGPRHAVGLPTPGERVEAQSEKEVIRCAPRVQGTASWGSWRPGAPCLRKQGSKDSVITT